MKTLLVPTDFSDSANNALRYACELAQQANCAIILLHCYQIPAGQGNVLIDFKDILERDSQTGLKKTVDAVQDEDFAAGLKFHTESYYGFLPEGIEVHAKKYAADLIVMGTTGASTLAKKWFGSNTAHLLKNTHLPVLVVPAGAKWQTWNQVIVATDYVPAKSGNIIRQLKKLDGSFNLRFDVLHVIQHENEPADFNKFESAFIAAVGSTNLTFHYQPAADVTQGILNYVEDHNCDLLVMLRRKHGFMEQLFQASATRKMALHAKNPVLLLQD